MRRDDGKEGSIPEDGKEKSERKRQREKQRRSELTNAFDDLSALVSRLDNSEMDECESDGTGRKKSRRLSGTNNGEDTSGMTRVDLINRALVIMKRLHQENSELKQSLSRAGDHHSNEVMVMVPTLTPADDGAPPPPAVGSFRPPYMPPPYPPPTPQQEHPPPMYGSAPSRHPPPPGAWGPYHGSPNHHYGGSPPIDHHDTRPPHHDTRPPHHDGSARPPHR